MIELSHDESSELQASVLGRRFPQVKKQLGDSEVLLAVSSRKPLRVAGAFSIFIGCFLIWQLTAFFLIPGQLWALPALLLSVVLIWVGIRWILLIKKELVFLTSERVAYMKVDMIGRPVQKLTEYPVSDITGVQLYRKSITYRSKENVIGDVLIKTGKKSYLLPTVWDSVTLSETLMTEIKHIRARRELADGENKQKENEKQ